MDAAPRADGPEPSATTYQVTIEGADLGKFPSNPLCTHSALGAEWVREELEPLLNALDMMMEVSKTGEFDAMDEDDALAEKLNSARRVSWFRALWETRNAPACTVLESAYRTVTNCLLSTVPSVEELQPFVLQHPRVRQLTHPDLVRDCEEGRFGTRILSEPGIREVRSVSYQGATFSWETVHKAISHTEEEKEKEEEEDGDPPKKVEEEEEEPAPPSKSFYGRWLLGFAPSTYRPIPEPGPEGELPPVGEGTLLRYLGSDPYVVEEDGTAPAGLLVSINKNDLNPVLQRVLWDTLGGFIGNMQDYAQSVNRKDMLLLGQMVFDLDVMTFRRVVLQLTDVARAALAELADKQGTEAAVQVALRSMFASDDQGKEASPASAQWSTGAWLRFQLQGGLLGRASWAEETGVLCMYVLLLRFLNAFPNTPKAKRSLAYLEAYELGLCMFHRLRGSERTPSPKAALQYAEYQLQAEAASEEEMAAAAAGAGADVDPATLGGDLLKGARAWDMLQMLPSEKDARKAIRAGPDGVLACFFQHVSSLEHIGAAFVEGKIAEDGEGGEEEGDAAE